MAWVLVRTFFANLKQRVTNCISVESDDTYHQILISNLIDEYDIITQNIDGYLNDSEIPNRLHKILSDTRKNVCFRRQQLLDLCKRKGSCTDKYVDDIVNQDVDDISSTCSNDLDGDEVTTYFGTKLMLKKAEYSSDDSSSTSTTSSIGSMLFYTDSDSSDDNDDIFEHTLRKQFKSSNKGGDGSVKSFSWNFFSVLRD
ncbi:hypothetical protein DP163_gp128 [Sea otter poxvirus]|uniref:Uncharacterized protein n=1 Tax=Sea otter poxvirus TaxID=1416741 RepID=A0A2U9QHV2_9POXV|nr:hypothetical protein DP163_gp128 [Sea otter poxvirus]AWU47173.1 hypothetical protein [Sea otter poxvirus]